MAIDLNLGPALQALVGGAMALGGVLATQVWSSGREIVKKRLDLAEETLTAFYEAEEAIAEIRSPGSWSSEGSTRPRQEGELPELTASKNRAYIYEERYHQRAGVFTNLYAKKHRFRAVFRDDSHQAFDEIARIVMQIRAAYSIWIETASDPFEYLPAAEYEQQRRNRINDRQEIQRTIWRGFGDDPIEPRVKAAIDRIEAVADRAAREYAEQWAPVRWWKGVMERNS